MRVTFVAFGAEQLAIGQLAAILRRLGHTVGLAFSRHLFDDAVFLPSPKLARVFADDDVVKQIGRQRPDVVCFSSITATHGWMLDVAAEVKARYGAKTIFGGAHPSAVPETVLEEEAVDFACIGEGDVALPALLDAIRLGRADRPLPNIAFRGPDGTIVRGPQLGFFQDLDRLPYFDKELWLAHVPVEDWYLTMSGRGCPFRCSFCFNSFFSKLGGSNRRRSGKYVRQRSVEHFIGELADAKRRYGIKYVDIEDDIFTLDGAWMKEFARRYRREVGVPFCCLSSPQFLDAERVASLKEAGCEWVQMGIQSADEGYRRKLGRPESQEQIEKAIELLHKAGIELRIDHIFGLPGESIEAQQKALDLYGRHDLGRIATFWLHYIPGTKIVREGLRAGTVTQDMVRDIEKGLSDLILYERSFKDPGLRRSYLEYESLFHLLPLLPAGLRRRLQPKHLDRLPDSVLMAIGMAADFSAGVLRRNADLRGYIAHYRLGLENHLRWRVGLDPRHRFGAADTGPIHDKAWCASWEEAVAAMEVS